MTKTILFSAFIFFLLGCSKEEDFVYSVPAELEFIIASFKQEAAKRGRQIELDNLIIEYADNLPPTYCGASNVISSENNVQKVIRISSTGGCWNCIDELENLIFHELGHCVLGRQHDNTEMPKGDPRSIMVSNNIQLYSSCAYAINGEPVNYYLRRGYYLDELFDPATPVPRWAK